MAPPRDPQALRAASAQPAPTPAPRARLRIVREASRLRPGPAGTVVITLVFGTLFVLAFLQAVLVQGQLELDQLDRQIGHGEIERKHREIAAATAGAPERIQDAATANGLVNPPEVVFLARANVEPLVRSGAGTVALTLDPAGPVPAGPVPVGPVPAGTSATATGPNGEASVARP